MTQKHQTETRLKAKILQAMVESALTGHHIGEWEAVDGNGRHYQAICQQCHQPALLSAEIIFIIPGNCPNN